MAGWDVQRAATAVLAAETAGADRVPLTDEWPALDGDLELAYAVQDEVLRRKLESGQVRTGVKLGLTARAKQRQMNVTAPLTGFLTDVMVLPAGEPVPQDQLIHPRAEPEIVFVLGRRLSGPGDTVATALAAVESVHAGIEVIDSRYRDFRFTLADVVADNASSARFALGPVARAPRELDLSLEACLLEVDGVIVDSATGAAVQGHPGEALALAANTLGARGTALEVGWLVLTGGLTPAVPIPAGTTVAAHFTSLGSVFLSGG